ncbi:MAG: carboxypeptidase-like regulatory domain-containing protein, partial [Bacteroidales bacterium]|nr:carboxypeptidase-like regulatory domain-containing protein [Bacteroidales bacterium]
MESKFLTRIAALLVTGIISVTAVFAQSPVSGRVTDAAGNPVAGVFIIAEGTNATASTDSDGNFSLTVPSNTNTLLFQMMGMNDERVAFDRRRARYEVTMTDSQNYLNEAVAIGYGTIIRRDLSTSVSSVSSEKLQERASAFNITQALAGKVAGYSVTNISGRPGGQNTIRIRGRGS